VRFTSSDFNGADDYFANEGSSEWSGIEAVVSSLMPQFQPHGQAGLEGAANFDPKATNHHLTTAAQKLGWHKVPVPGELTEFGLDWDAGKGGTLAEWQFSNYPFLWNNIIRTEGVYRSGTSLLGVPRVRALLVVTKSGSLPASNSTLYYEQAHKQVSAAVGFNAFTVPIRLVGLTVDPDCATLEVDWNEYPARYGREARETTRRTMNVRWGRARKHGQRPITLS
jgi:hypothetical protein